MDTTKTLAELRSEKKLSQRELAKELELSPGAIGMYESGQRTPPLNKAIRIARYFSVPVETIVFSSSILQQKEGAKKCQM